jgi:uncharacterized DUF497 family protein
MARRRRWARVESRASNRGSRTELLEAQAFTDPLSMDFADAVYPDRLVTLALSPAERMLYVVTTERGLRTRIISARRASSHERRIYEGTP